MTSTNNESDLTDLDIFFSQINILPDDYIAIGINEPGKPWRDQTITAREAIILRDKNYLKANIFFSTGVLINKHSGRSNQNVSRVPVLILDLDFKPTGIKTEENAKTLIAEVAKTFGPPDLIVHSGNGYHCYWTLADEPDTPLHEVKFARVAFGKYAQQLASDLKLGKIDDIFDCSRYLRLPNTGNFKNIEDRKAVRVIEENARVPLSPSQVASKCLEIVRKPITLKRGALAKAMGELVASDPDKWRWANTENCANYLEPLISGQALREDYQKSGNRHSSLGNNIFRLESHRRYECLTETMYRTGLKTIEATFLELLKSNEPVREPHENEFAKYQAYVEYTLSQMNHVEFIDNNDLREHPKFHNQNPKTTGKSVKDTLPTFDIGDRKYPGKLVKPASNKIIITRNFHEDPATREAILKCAGFNPLAGPGAVGKSSMACWYASRISTGTLPGVHYGVPKNVVIYTTEDDWNRVWVPKIIINEGNLDNFRLFEPERVNGNVVRFNLAQYGPYIGEQMHDNDAALGIIEAAHRHAIPAKSDYDIGTIIEDTNPALVENDMMILALLPTIKNALVYENAESVIFGDQGWVLASRQVSMGLIKDIDKGKQYDRIRQSAVVKNNLGVSESIRHFTFERHFIPVENEQADSVKFIWTPEHDTGQGIHQQHGQKLARSRGALNAALGSYDEDHPTDENGKPLTESARSNWNIQRNVIDLLETHYPEKLKDQWSEVFISTEDFFEAINKSCEENFEVTQKSKRRFERAYNKPVAEMPFEFVKYSDPDVIRATPKFLQMLAQTYLKRGL